MRLVSAISPGMDELLQYPLLPKAAHWLQLLLSCVPAAPWNLNQVWAPSSSPRSPCCLADIEEFMRKLSVRFNVHIDVHCIGISWGLWRLICSLSCRLVVGFEGSFCMLARLPQLLCFRLVAVCRARLYCRCWNPLANVSSAGCHGCPLLSLYTLSLLISLWCCNLCWLFDDEAVFR